MVRHGVSVRKAGRKGRLIACAPVALVAAFVATAADDPELYLPDGVIPPVLERVDLPPDLQALSVSPDGRRVAIGELVSEQGRPPTTLIRVHDLDRAEPVDVPLRGVVRGLVDLGVPAGLFAIEHRPAKKREGDTYLVQLDLETGKAPRVMRLPPSARDLEFWPGGRSLLVAARNEIRSVTLPLIRSGPLYRIPGENYSIAIVEGTRVLVGQADALLLVDLADPQSRESMRIRERLDTPAPVISLALARGGSSGVAGLADRRVVELRMDPLAFDEVGTGLVVERRTHAEQPAATPIEPVSEPIEEEDELEPSPAPDRDDTGSVALETAPATETPAAVEVQRGDPWPLPAIVPFRGPEPHERPADAEEVASRTAPEPEPAPQIRGRIDGPAAGDVVWVVFYGPDSLLTEAKRASPGPDGRYEVDDLAPGRYWIQLDGGGRRQLIAQPPSRSVVVEPDSETVADFHVARAL